MISTLIGVDSFSVTETSKNAPPKYQFAWESNPYVFVIVREMFLSDGNTEFLYL